MSELCAVYKLHCPGYKPRIFTEAKDDELKGKIEAIVKVSGTCGNLGEGNRCNLNDGDCWLEKVDGEMKIVVNDCHGVKPFCLDYILSRKKCVKFEIKMKGRCGNLKPGRVCNLSSEECWLKQNFVHAIDEELDDDRFEKFDQSEDPFNQNAEVASQE